MALWNPDYRQGWIAGFEACRSRDWEAVSKLLGELTNGHPMGQAWEAFGRLGQGEMPLDGARLSAQHIGCSESYRDANQGWYGSGPASE